MSLPNRTFAKLDFPTPVVPSTTIRGSGKFDLFGAKKLGRVEKRYTTAQRWLEKDQHNQHWLPYFTRMTSLQTGAVILFPSVIHAVIIHTAYDAHCMYDGKSKSSSSSKKHLLPSFSPFSTLPKICTFFASTCVSIFLICDYLVRFFSRRELIYAAAFVRLQLARLIECNCFELVTNCKTTKTNWLI